MINHPVCVHVNTIWHGLILSSKIKPFLYNRCTKSVKVISLTFAAVREWRVVFIYIIEGECQ